MDEKETKVVIHAEYSYKAAELAQKWIEKNAPEWTRETAIIIELVKVY